MTFITLIVLTVLTMIYFQDRGIPENEAGSVLADVLEVTIILSLISYILFLIFG